MEEEEEEEKKRDIRRYTCEYCGIVRSKKTIITAHIQSHHKDELKEKGCDEKGEKMNVCEECGVSFQKPAHLKQHMQSHSLERPFTCPVDDCNSSYRRKDHLNRHLLQHEGKLFNCPNEKCMKKFSIHGNMTQHVKKFHCDKGSSSDVGVNDKKEHICLEPGCGKVFKYASKLQKHEESHVRLEIVEAFCAEPGCMKYFTNEQCLKAHLQSCHQHVNCEICGSKHLKKNIKRHLQTHDKVTSNEKIKCSFDGCKLTFSKNSNLQQHIKSAHFQEKPFVCSVSGCEMRFAYKHVRDNHEKSGQHVYTLGDFVEADKQFQSKPKGAEKRKLPDAIKNLMAKKMLPPSKSDGIHGSDYVSFLNSAENED